MDDDLPPDDDRRARRARDGTLVRALRAGDPDAFTTLFDDWFDRVHDVVRRIVRRPDIADEVTQEAFLAAWRRLDTLDQPEAFGGWLLRIARNAALNRHQREQRSAAVDDRGLAVIEETGGSPAGAPAGFSAEDRLGRAASPTAAAEDAEIASLVWDAAEALGPRDVEVLDLQLRHGLSPAEIGDLLDLNRNAANQLVHRLKGRLEQAVRARVVWRSGRPACPELSEHLAARSITSFSGDAVREIERHRRSCAGCDERQRLQLQPSALFAAVPIMVVPLAIRQQAAAALVAQGVPMQASASIAGAAGAPGGGGPSGSSGSGTGSPAGTGGPPGAGSTPGTTTPGTTAALTVGGPPTPPATAGPPTAGSARGRRRLALGAVAAAVVVALVLFGLRPVLAGGDLTAGGPEVTAPTAPAPAASSPTGPAPGLAGDPAAPASVPAPDDGPAPGAPAGPTTTAAGAATSTTSAAGPDPELVLSITPATAPPRWPLGAPAGAAAAPVPTPTVRWSVTPASAGAAARVTGPEGEVGTGPSGRAAVCPGTVVRSTCAAPAGTYTYTLTVPGPGGRALTRSATLTVTGQTTTTTTTSKPVINRVPTIPPGGLVTRP